MKKTLVLILSISFLLINCRKDKKENISSESSKEINIISEKDEVNKKIINFFNNNDSVSDNSYNELYTLIKEDYLLNRDNNKYQMLINVAKKAFNEKDLHLKNVMYNNLKDEFLKNK